jgi:hypothetical protein
MVLQGDKAQEEARFGLFGDCPNLDEDKCTVCAKHTVA